MGDLKITKKELKKVWESTKELPFDWKVLGVYVYVWGGKLNVCMSYAGQGILDVIYNNKVQNEFFTTDEIFSDFTNFKDAAECAKQVIENRFN